MTPFHSLGLAENLPKEVLNCIPDHMRQYNSTLESANKTLEKENSLQKKQIEELTLQLSDLRECRAKPLDELQAKNNYLQKKNCFFDEHTSTMEAKLSALKEENLQLLQKTSLQEKNIINLTHLNSAAAEEIEQLKEQTTEQESTIRKCAEESLRVLELNKKLKTCNEELETELDEQAEAHKVAHSSFTETLKEKTVSNTRKIQDLTDENEQIRSENKELRVLTEKLQKTIDTVFIEKIVSQSCSPHSPSNQSVIDQELPLDASFEIVSELLEAPTLSQQIAKLQSELAQAKELINKLVADVKTITIERDQAQSVVENLSDSTSTSSRESDEFLEKLLREQCPECLDSIASTTPVESPEAKEEALKSEGVTLANQIEENVAELKELQKLLGETDSAETSIATQETLQAQIDILEITNQELKEKLMAIAEELQAKMQLASEPLSEDQVEFLQVILKEKLTSIAAKGQEIEQQISVLKTAGANPGLLETLQIEHKKLHEEGIDLLIEFIQKHGPITLDGDTCSLDEKGNLHIAEAMEKRPTGIAVGKIKDLRVALKKLRHRHATQLPALKKLLSTKNELLNNLKTEISSLKRKTQRQSQELVSLKQQLHKSVQKPATSTVSVQPTAQKAVSVFTETIPYKGSLEAIQNQKQIKELEKKIEKLSKANAVASAEHQKISDRLIEGRSNVEYFLKKSKTEQDAKLAILVSQQEEINRLSEEHNAVMDQLNEARLLNQQHEQNRAMLQEKLNELITTIASLHSAVHTSQENAEKAEKEHARKLAALASDSEQTTDSLKVLMDQLVATHKHELSRINDQKDAQTAELKSLQQTLTLTRKELETGPPKAQAVQDLVSRIDPNLQNSIQYDKMQTTNDADSHSSLQYSVETSPMSEKLKEEQSRNTQEINRLEQQLAELNHKNANLQNRLTLATDSAPVAEDDPKKSWIELINTVRSVTLEILVVELSSFKALSQATGQYSSQNRP